jgi:outer membrane protein TolC
MTKQRTAILLFLFMVGSVEAAAKSNPVSLPQGPLSLQSCIEFALEHNPATRSAWLAGRSAEEDVGIQKASLYPSVSAGASLTTSGDLTSDSSRQQDGTWVSAGFSVRYLLFDGGARRGRIHQAKARLEIAGLRHLSKVLDVALSVQEAYFAAQGALWFQQVVEQIIDQTRYQHQLASARYEVGLARRYDMIQAEARLAESEVNRSSAAGQVRESTGRLLKAMGMDPRTPVELLSLSDKPEALPLSDVDWFMEQAVAHRPELAEAKAVVQEALASVQVARSGHMPAVTADAYAGTSYNRELGSGVPWSAGVGVSIPLFSGFAPTHEIRKARFEEEKAREDLKGKVTDIQFEVWSAYQQVVVSRDSVLAADKLYGAAEEGVLLAEENYRNGMGTIVEVFDAQGVRAYAGLKRVEVRTEGLLAMARLERSVAAALGGAASGTGEVR